MGQENLGIVITVVCLVLAIYVFVAAAIEHHHWSFIHQTTVCILMGLAVGALLLFLANFRFHIPEDLVFYVMLPPILFSRGYNLSKRKFFQNVPFIALFGILSTIFNFFLYAALIYAFNHANLVIDLANQSVSLNITQILLLSAVLCSTDPAGPLTVLKPALYPKLFSIVFGQSLIKDVITLVLFNSINKLTKEPFGPMTLHWYSTFEVIGYFLLDITVSSLIGILFGVIITLIFKKFRFMEKAGSPIEIALIFLLALVSYTVPEMLTMSGVLSILVCGIFLAHFNFYNLSNYGVMSSKDAFQFIAIIIQGLLFLYLGLSFWQFNVPDYDQKGMAYSWTLILYSFLILVLVRLISIYCLGFLFGLCMNKRLNMYQLNIVSFSGIIKGAVPFALIISMESDSQSAVIIKSTVGILVISTSIFFNAIIPQWVSFNLRKISVKSSLKENLLESSKQVAKKGKKLKLWKKFDNWVKPFLIYNYLYRREDIRLAKNKLFQRELYEIYGEQLIENVDLSSIRSSLRGNHSHDSRSAVELQAPQEQDIELNELNEFNEREQTEQEQLHQPYQGI